MSFRERSLGTTLIMAVLFSIFGAAFLWAQGDIDQSQDNDPASLIGMTLDELLNRFGTPRSVYAVRGLEEWQDDVVFVYDHGDFYVFKDRVWQLGLKEAWGIKAGDSQPVVSLVLGSKSEYRQNSIFYSLDDRSWPLMLRCDFSSDAKLQVIFIYRTDF